MHINNLNASSCLPHTRSLLSYTAQVMIISYETFRIHAERFNKPESVGLVMCDEAGTYTRPPLSST
jgi:hypothetical protein